MLQIGIKACFTPRTGWEVYVGHACMSVACVSLTLVFHVTVECDHADHGCNKVIMRNMM